MSINLNHAASGRPLRRQLAAAGAALLAAVSLAACTSGPESATQSAAPKGGTLTIGSSIAPIGWSIDTLGPGGPLAQMWQPVYDTLLRLEPDGSIQPNAAESFSFSPDRTTLTLKLRSGMKFTDGTEVDSSAVKKDLEAVRDSKNPGAVTLAGAVVTSPDPSTVTVKMPAPTPLLPQSLTSSPGALVSPASMTAPDAATHPVGSGPYKIDMSATTSGAVYSFLRNEDYWNKDAFPYDRVVIKVLTDPTAALNALRSGQINAIELSGQTAPQAKAAGLTLLESQTSWSGLNIADHDGKMTPALKDVRVRKAINMVFDRDSIAKNLFKGQAVPTGQIYNPKSPAYDPSLNSAYAYDVDAAKKLMADAGYAAGFDVTMPSIAGITDVGNPLVKQQLALLNIRVNFETVSAQDGFVQVIQGKWPMFYFGVGASTPASDVANAVAPSAVFNTMHTSDPDLSRLLAAAATAPDDQAVEAYREVARKVSDLAWFAPWVATTSFYGLDNKTTAQTVPGDANPPIWSFKPAS